MALTFDQITAITNKYYMPKFPQLVFDQNLVQKRLAAKGSKPQSGESIKQPVMHAMSKGGFFDPYDTFDISAEDQVTAADFNWKYLEVPITISRDEILKNAGPEGIKKLMDAKMKLARMACSNLLADAMFNVASPGTDSSTALNSFENMLENTAGLLNSAGGSGLGTTPSYGGISKDDYAWWTGNVVSAGGSGGGMYYQSFSNFFWTICDGNIQPDLMVMHNMAFGTFIGGQQSQERYVKQTEMDAGFLTATFNGKTMVADLHVSNDTSTLTTNRVYFLNTDFIDFVTHKDENNRLEPFAKPVDQAVSVAHIMWAGELTSSDPSRSGVVCNLDTDDATIWV